MVTVPEAARRVGRNPETIRRWIREGRLRSQRVGTQHLIDEAELDLLVRPVELIRSVHDERTATGEAMPNFLDALHRSRQTK